jgi:dTDP-4-amino-4,6-dideoxygalactose transaminase
MRLHGMNRDAFDRFTAKVPSWYYEVVAPGFKYNLTDIAAALGIHQLRRAQGFQQRREAIAARYDAAFADLPLLTPPRPPAGDRHAWHLYVLRLADDAGITRDRLHRAAVRHRHRLQRALHPAAPAPLLARPLRAASRRSSRTASRPTSAC